MTGLSSFPLLNALLHELVYLVTGFVLVIQKTREDHGLDVLAKKGGSGSSAPHEILSTWREKSSAVIRPLGTGQRPAHPLEERAAPFKAIHFPTHRSL